MEKETKQIKKKYKIGWPKVIGILALILLVIVLICYLYPKKSNKNNVEANATYIKNISLMKEAGFDFFKGNNLPEKTGDTNRISLFDMISNNLIVEFLDEKGDTCNETSSYVQTTKVMDNEYRMKVYLSCDYKSDYIETLISTEENCKDCNSNSNSNNTNNTTTKKPSNQVNNYYNNNNQNSGSNKTPTVNKVYNITYVNGCVGSCVSNTYYTVNFNSNGGNAISSQTVKKDGYAYYIAPSRDGYRFLGWYLDNKKFDFKTKITKTITLEAKWEKIPNENVRKKYTVSFDTNGGTKVSNQIVLEGNQVEVPKNPTKNCYDFIGWYYYDVNGNLKRFDFNSAIYKDITLYADWEYNDICNKNSYTVKFVYNNGRSSITKTVEEGAKVSKPNDPTYDGYDFAGWYLNGSEYNFNSRIYNDITLEAHWEPSGYVSKFCKIKSEPYYSIAYIGSDVTSTTLSWKIKFDNIHSDNLRVNWVYHLSSLASYNNAVSRQYNKGISMVGGNSKYSVYVPSGAVLQASSLKSTNFSENVSAAYKENGKWYIDLTAYIKNTYNVVPYYAPNLGYGIYFVPYIIEVKYTDLDDCTVDLAKNKNKYKDNYDIVESYYR